jgi:RAD50-interacting protein 1
MTITEAKTSDDAVKSFESSMGKLRRLDLARGYLQLLQEVESIT